MRVVWVVLVIASGGCDKLFGLDHLNASGDGSVISDGMTGDAFDRGHECFDGTFDGNSIDPATFTLTVDPNVAITAASGQVTVTIPSQLGVSYGIVETKSDYDLTDGMISVDLLEVPGDHAEAELSIYLATDGAKRQGITVGSGDSQFFIYNDGPFTTVHTIHYGSTPPRFLRLWHRVSTNEIVYEVSTDATTWFGFASPAVLDVTHSVAQIDAGAYAYSMSPGRGVFDNFKVFSHDCFR